MDFREFFAAVVKALKKEKVRYALAGGLVASLYRLEERLTKDLDFLILSESGSHRKAMQIISTFGLKPNVIRKADLEGGPLFAIRRKNTPPWIVAGRAEGDSSRIGLDFILPDMPWFTNALTRAEQNNIDFGFGKIPCLTVEDLIIAKLFSLKNDQTRFADLDDLKSIFLSQRPLDLDYMSGQIQRLGLVVPPPLKEVAPKSIQLVSRKRK